MSHKCCCRLHYFNCQLLPLQLWLVAIASCCHSGLVGLAYSLRPLPLKNNNHKKCAAVCNKNVTAQNECCRHSCDNVHLATHKHIHLCGYDHASWKANYALYLFNCGAFKFTNICALCVDIELHAKWLCNELHSLRCQRVLSRTFFVLLCSNCKWIPWNYRQRYENQWHTRSIPKNRLLWKWVMH